MTITTKNAPGTGQGSEGQAPKEGTNTMNTLSALMRAARAKGYRVDRDGEDLVLIDPYVGGVVHRGDVKQLTHYIRKNHGKATMDDVCSFADKHDVSLGHAGMAILQPEGQVTTVDARFAGGTITVTTSTVAGVPVVMLSIPGLNDLPLFSSEARDLASALRAYAEVTR
ncbi:MAG: hypothetical protein QM677_02545 [Microbacterium sp.]